MEKLAVLTGGGDAPGLNAVIRAVVKTAQHDYDVQVLGVKDGFDGFVEEDGVRPLHPHDVRGILPRGGTILGTANRGNPFARKVIRDGKEVVEDISEKLIRNINDLKLDGLIVIGGDGTLRIARELFEKGVPVVGVPKTIDNDIGGTECTFGFDTAVGTATDALDKLHTTAESHHRVMLLELMGRDAGFITLHAGVAGGADVILIPEIPFSFRGGLQKGAPASAPGQLVQHHRRGGGGVPEGRAAGGIHPGRFGLRGPAGRDLLPGGAVHRRKLPGGDARDRAGAFAARRQPQRLRPLAGHPLWLGGGAPGGGGEIWADGGTEERADRGYRYRRSPGGSQAGGSERRCHPRRQGAGDIVWGVIKSRRRPKRTAR